MHRLDNLVNCAEPYCSTGSPSFYGVDIYEMGGALGGPNTMCVDPDNMQEYFYDNVGYINLYKPENKSFIRCNSYQDVFWPGYYGQVMVVYYGNWTCGGGSE